MSDYIDALVEKEEWAYNELVRDYSKKIFNLCFYILHDRKDAEDLTQEVFISIFQSIGSFRQESKLSTWIYRLTVNKCSEKLRYQSRTKRKGNLVSIEQLFEIKNFEISPEEKLIKKQEYDALFQAIRLLPDNQRIAYTMHNMEEYSYNEIAQSMDLSLSAVESLIFRAKKNLKISLLSYFND